MGDLQNTGKGESVICRTVVVAWCVIVPLQKGLLRGQSVRSLVNDGNGLYEQQRFNDAEISYRKALEKEPGLVEGHFNLGNSLYKQGEFDKSVREYQNAALNAQQKETKASAYYNIGNAHLKGGDYQNAVRAYVESLKINPADEEAKYNLSYALQRLKEQQPQQNQNEQGQEKNKEQQQDRNDQNKNSDQRQEQPKQDRQQQQQDQERQQQEKQERQISKADAERILEALKKNELDVQKKLRVRRGMKAKTDRDW
jgi:tetratricopeptide (TPR) repeat protein